MKNLSTKDAILSLLLVSLSCVHQAHSTGPWTLFETLTRYFRQGNRYAEDHVTDIPPQSLLRHYDFIVIGSGPAGSVLANRLSENPAWTVLLLEAGRDEIALMDIPMMAGYWQSTDYNWGYTTEPQGHACLGMKDKRCRWPRGKSLGGSSSINYMIYTRGNRLDFDRWAEAGNEGWSYDEVLPYFMKSENNLMPELRTSAYHARGGYLNVETVPYRYEQLGNAFIEAGEELGIRRADDYNGRDQLGFSFIQGNLRNGSRCSASKAFLRPIRDRKNLHISLNSRVTRIIVDPTTKEAIGVEFVRNRKTFRIKIRKEVIVSAGSLNSPQLLMLSGIGPEEHLQELGIPLIKNLQVGENLQEHVTFYGLIHTLNATISEVEERFLRVDTLASNSAQYTFSGRGPLTHLGGVQSIGFVRTKYAEDERPDVELLLVAGGVQFNENFLQKGIGVSEELSRIVRPVQNTDCFSIWPLVLRPKSRGYVKLNDKNPFHWPKFYANFFSDPRDIKTLVEGIKIGVEVGKTLAFQKYGAKIFEVPVPGCTEFPFGSDEYWECSSRYMTGTIHHQVGTCRMGPPGDGGAVVDPQLRVYGVERLRVADASVMPLVPSAHTAAACYMIGEKAADMIKATWSQ